MITDNNNPIDIFTVLLLKFLVLNIIIEDKIVINKRKNG